MTIKEMEARYQEALLNTKGNKHERLVSLIKEIKETITGEPTAAQYEVLIAWQKEVLGEQHEKRKSCHH